MGFRPGSVIVDYHMKVGETNENQKIDKENLVDILRVMIEENEDKTIFEAASVMIEGNERNANFVLPIQYNHTGAITNSRCCTISMTT